MAKSKRKKKKEVRVQNGVRRRKIQVPARNIKRRKGSEREVQNRPLCKLTLAARKTCYAAVEAGLSISRCKFLISVSANTWGKYLAYGKDPRYKKYYNFVQRLKQIEKNREIEALSIVRQAANEGFTVEQTKIKSGPHGTTVENTKSNLSPQWQAAAWFLERKDRLNWGREADATGGRSPSEIVEEIQQAQLRLKSSVPMSPKVEEGEE